MIEDLLKLTNDPSYPNDLIYDSSILIINNNNINLKEEGGAVALSRSLSSSSSSLKFRKPSIVPDALDITRISDRLLVTSRCWHHHGELAEFLNTKYRDKYLLWNVGTPESLSSPLGSSSAFNYRLIPCVLPKSQHPTLKTIFHLCHSMTGWLQLDPENVVIIQCTDGWSRSGLLVSCLLKFCGNLESTFDAFNLFQSRRLKSTKIPGTTSQTLLRYLKYFNETINLRGRVPNPKPICLHQLILSTIPNFDGSGSCSPGLEIFQGNELILSTTSIADKSKLSSDIYIFKDDYNVIFKLKENSLKKDIQLNIFHCHPKTGQRIPIISFTFNTAFFHPGVIRLRPDDLEIPLKDVEAPAILFPDASTMKSGQKRFKEDFCIDLILLPATEMGMGEITDYCSTIRNNEAKNLLRLSQLIPVRSDRSLLPPLLLQSYPKFYAKLALQLYANDIHRAHEFLEKLRGRQGMREIEKSLLELVGVKGDVDLRDESVTAQNASANAQSVTVTARSSSDNAQSVVTSTHIAHVTSVDAPNQPSPGQSKDPLIIEKTSSAPLPSFSGIGIKPSEGEGCPAPPPPPPPLPVFNTSKFTVANPPPPPPLPVPNSSTYPTTTNTPTIHPTNNRPKIKNTLHWNELNSQLSEIGTTIWHEIATGDVEAQVELNTKMFEEMFCIEPPGSKKKPQIRGNDNGPLPADLAPVILPVVIDIRRANNVGIGLSRFQRRFETPSSLIKELKLANNLDLDDLLTLKGILPTEEECKNLKLIRKTDRILMDRMGKAEQFMHAMAQEDEISSIIDYKIFEMTCWQDFTCLKSKFEMISGVLEALKTSNELKIILKATLDLGNLATYEYGRFPANSSNPSAFGFTLDSLCKLHEVKSVDSQSNLLIFLTASLAQHQNQAEILSLPAREEFRDLDLIKQWSDKQLKSEYKLLEEVSEEMINKSCDNTKNLDFWMDAKSKLSSFKNHLRAFQASLDSYDFTWQSTRNYFGYSGNEDVSGFLTTIWQFFRNFEAAVKQHTKEQLKLNRSSSSSISNP